MAGEALYDLGGALETRSICFENPTGARGAGGQAASPLGVGRKGDPARTIGAGETVTLADIEGPGTIRHIWLTSGQSPKVFRGAVVRAYWDGQEHPSIEAPLGDLFGFAHGRTPPFQSHAHTVGERYALNLWLPMPFARRARLTLTNELSRPIPLFYQVDYTLGDAHGGEVGRLHAAFARSNPTTPGRDFEILPKREGRGRYLGAVIGVRPLAGRWWGEGEAKIFLDGDGDFPSVCGTGSEDYVGLSYGLQPTPFAFHGCNWREADDMSDTGRVSMYRWHVPDPVVWRQDIRVTIQQIGLGEGTVTDMETYKAALVERADDWSACAFWYEAVPSARLPPMPDVAARTADLPG
ncbi:MAG: DUF2961 domain-containing protein [Phenylobacterium sp.]|uniref:glycoside hydrolase family 172 protein n=1 Tax=Phenylobacterium sp. TaxID=1871053 RepID=UPI002600F4D1|nr:glycoside hydrolase family 172 protein [Phenylobacterium sp.]MBI1200097.1 DUF2961 domain-containing protein [Phenylobacterium sp.]